MAHLSFDRRLAIYSILAVILGALELNQLNAGPPPTLASRGEAPTTKHWREAESCGVACGYMLARFLGRDVNYDDAVAAIPVENHGTSLLALQNGLRTLGVPTSVLKAGPGELDRMAMPVIAHVFPRREISNSVGHFLLLLEVDGRWVRYIEPNYAAAIVTVPRTQFVRSWSGYLVVPAPKESRAERYLEIVLWGAFAATISIGVAPVGRAIVARPKWSRAARRLFSLGAVVVASVWISGCTWSGTPRSSELVAAGPTSGMPKMPRPIAWNTDVDLGALPRGGAADALFRIENQGDAPLRLHLGAPSCRCSEAHLEREVVGPGESTNVRMVMRSRPRQAGPANAQVYVEAEGGNWAETFGVHAFELGANFPDYTYVIGGPSGAVRRASIIGNLFLKTPATTFKVDVPLTRVALASLIAVGHPEFGPPIEMAGCVRRQCTFTIGLDPKAKPVKERRDVILPISITIDGETSAYGVRVTVLPGDRPTISQARLSP
jgi:Peptidase C39 family/Protein of unknown function (DUF1573)